MKNIASLIIVLCIAISANSQEKKIKFNEGVLRICSSKNFQISGYDGTEVIIKSLHEKKGYSFITEGWSNGKNSASSIVRGYKSEGGLNKISKSSTSSGSATNLTGGKVVFNSNDPKRKEGLKKLGKNNDTEDLGIYFQIEVKNGELIFRDKNFNNLVLVTGEKYEVKVPNSIKIEWVNNGCSSNLKKANNKYVIYRQDPSKISNFKGELVMNTTIQNIELVDVSGPVSLNSLGGNFTIVFDKTKPNELYSVYTNNGFIDVTLPKESSLNVKAIGKSIFSDLDFEIISEKEINDFGHINQEMNLKLNSGKVKMNFNAGYGNVYLRKKA